MKSTPKKTTIASILGYYHPMTTECDQCSSHPFISEHFLMDHAIFSSTEITTGTESTEETSTGSDSTTETTGAEESTIYSTTEGSTISGSTEGNRS